jgi:integrase
MTRRSKNEGSVYLDRSRGCWVGSVDVAADPDTGKRRRRKVSAPDKTACLAKLAALRAEKLATGTVAPRDVTVETVVRAWLANLPPEIKSPTTVTLVNDLGERVIKAIGKTKLAQLKPPAVERFLRTMAADGYSTSTIAQTKRVLARAIRRAERDDLISRNVAALADTPAGTRRVSRSMTAIEARRLLTADLGAFWHAWVTMGVECGLRPGELAGLTWDDVDFSEGVIRVRHSLKRVSGAMALEDLKTETSRRTIAMPKATRTALLALRKEQAADKLRLGEHYAGLGTVFSQASGRPVNRQYVNMGFKRATDRAGLGRDWQPRELRHTNVSVLSDAGVSIEDISASVGHKNSNITKTTYRHVIADKLTRATTAMDRLALAGGETA